MPSKRQDSTIRAELDQTILGDEQPALAADDNSWHREWMEGTKNAYEWWYFDSVSKDGQWSLVVIFLLGSPFSPYTRACELNQNPDPLKHNGVFVALHHRGRLLHYQYARYLPEQIAGSAVGDRVPMALEFGPNSWRFDPGSGEYVILLNEENSNRRRMSARLRFYDPFPQIGKSNSPLSVLAEPGHSWLPTIVGGQAHCTIDLHSPAETRDPERIDFRGSAYHDHNWGTLPFSSTLSQWLWARADFSPGSAAVLYQTTPTGSSGKSKTILLTRVSGEPLRVRQSGIIASVQRGGRNGYGISYPREIAAKVDGGEICWRFGRSLESTPFYMRCETDAVWRTGNDEAVSQLYHGRGIGEMLRPRGMGAWLVSHAMRLRIHEPGL